MRQSFAPFALLALSAVVGCAAADQTNGSLTAGDVVVAIPRDVDASTVATRDAALQSRGLGNITHQ